METHYLSATTGSIVGPVQKMKPRVVETERDLNKAQENISVSGSFIKALTGKVLWLREALLAVRVLRVIFRVGLDEMTMVEKRMKKKIWKMLSIMSAEVQKTYDDMVDAVIRGIKKGVVDGRKKIKMNFWIESARLEMSVGDKLLRWISDVQRLLETSRSLFRNRATKALDGGKKLQGC